MKHSQTLSHPNSLKELRYDKQRFYPTVRDIEEWFVILNRHIFENQLKRFDRVYIRTYNEFHALYQGWEEDGKTMTQLEMCKYWENKKVFVEILAHEMIHLYQDQHNEPVDHGPTFRRWRERFIKNGLKFRKEM